jgi:CheY-like chemotaxis protein
MVLGSRQPTVAPNGLAALDEASFDLMIVDIFMPHMRGFESIRIFHQRAPTVPLIAISGYAFSLLNVIDECLSEAEPQRRHAATLAAVASAPEPREKPLPLEESNEGAVTG